MNGTEVEALLLRVDVTYPRGQLSDIERRMRIEEWLDTAVAAVDWPTVGVPAWRRWKDQRDHPPTPHQFVEACRTVLNERRLDRPRLPEPALTDEQRAQGAEFARAARAAIRGTGDE